MNAKITIKMTALDSNRKRYEVTPDTISLEDVNKYMPVFLADDKWVTIPGCTAEMVLEDWLNQYQS